LIKQREIKKNKGDAEQSKRENETEEKGDPNTMVRPLKCAGRRKLICSSLLKDNKLY